MILILSVLTGSSQRNVTCDKVRQDWETALLDKYWLYENENCSNTGHSNKTNYSKLVEGKLVLSRF